MGELRVCRGFEAAGSLARAAIAASTQRYLTQLLNNLPATAVGQLDRWLPDE